MVMISGFHKPLLALTMASYLLFFLTSPSMAGMVGSIASPEFGAAQNRMDETKKIQLALENELVRAKLKAYGLTSDEIEKKLQGMTDEQINLLAQASDDVLAGGDGISFVIGVLVIALLVILILKLSNKTIVVK
jgi:hypothetical protein